jgi:hypothetical protein
MNPADLERELKEAGIQPNPLPAHRRASHLQTLTAQRSWREAVRVRVNRLVRGLFSAVTILCLAAAVGCKEMGRRPYDTPRSRLEGGQAVALLQREARRRGARRAFARAEKVETHTPSGTYAWLVRLVSEDDSRGDLCAFVWRGEEAGRADGTVIRIQFDRDCRHWPE